MQVLERARTDGELQADVLAEIARDPRFKPAELGVEVDDGVVTLTGTVSSYAKVGAAAEIATSVTGVRDVANELVVHLPGISLRDDTDVAKAVRHALEWEPEVPQERLDSIVRQGVVTLRGSVEHWYERRAAQQAVTHLIGVVAVRNEIHVVPAKRSDLDIADDVYRTLDRRLGGRATRVVVEARKAVVTLSGRVPTYADRIDAEHAAWSTSGVRGVMNSLAVTG